MSLQTIIDNATYITVTYNKVAGQSISRSGRLLTSEVASAVPFRFTVGMHDGLTYSTNRELLAQVMDLDITEESTITISNTNTGLNYVTAYQGDIPDPTDIIYNAHSGSDAKTLNINTTSTAGGTGNIFKAGDYISASGGHRYSYIVTADVPWSNSSNIAVPIHRNFIPQDSYTISGKDVVAGVNCPFTVKMLSKPDYNIVPHDRIQFTADFELIESIRKQDG
jgi:hypothetical protein